MSKDSTKAKDIMTNVSTTFCIAIGLVSVGLQSFPGSIIHFFDMRVIWPLSIIFPMLFDKID